MKNTFALLLQQLKDGAIQFNQEAIPQQEKLLKQLLDIRWNQQTDVIALQEILLFILAHAPSKRIHQLTQKLASALRRYMKVHASEQHQDTGLPYAGMTTRYSHDLLVWLMACRECRLHFAFFDEEGIDLNSLLRMSLPATERDETSAGLSNVELLEAMHVKPKHYLSFLLYEWNRFQDKPLVKDFLWESLKLWVRIEPVHISYSRLYNRLPLTSIFYHTDRIKRFDHEVLMASELPDPLILNQHERDTYARVIRFSLTLTMRETDPSTYMDTSQLRVFDLDRGIRIAIYDMMPNRQLSFQSYIGYTLFKNGYPAAYGGSWIFGKSAMFGLNIFEAFRGGESGYMMCQLLRVYTRQFKLHRIEVEPYQYGRDNPDGIQTGAFWFYYRYGFRPTDATLKQLASREANRMRKNPKHRSTPKTLLQFTESPIALEQQPIPVITLTHISNKIHSMIEKRFQGNRLLAEETCRRSFLANCKKEISFTPSEQQTLTDFSLLAAAYECKHHKTIDLMCILIRLKTSDPYSYHSQLHHLLLMLSSS